MVQLTVSLKEKKEIILKDSAGWGGDLLVGIVALHRLDVTDKGGLRGRGEHGVVVARQAWNLQ